MAKIPEKKMPDDGVLVDLFQAWTPDPAHRRAILSDNPACFYGFDQVNGQAK